MKKLIVTMALIASAKIATAQNPCYIKYTYDGSGNRIKREFICAPVDSTNGSEENPGGGGSNFRLAQNNTNSNFDFNVHPNPTKATFTLVMSRINDNTQITIYNSTGQQLLQKNTNKLSMEFDLGKFVAGTYYINVLTNKDNITKKLMKL